MDTEEIRKKLEKVESEYHIWKTTVCFETKMEKTYLNLRVP